MTCRRCCAQGQQPYDIADVMKFLIDPPKARESEEDDDAAASTDDCEGREDFHAWASVPPDRPMGRRRATEAAYRFAWNG